MTTLFYAAQVEGDLIVLTAEESHHCISVLRCREGQQVKVTDGRGNLYEAVITVAHAKQCQLRMISAQAMPVGYRIPLHIWVAPTKNADRTEWLVEKCTEIGVASIGFLQCRYSERKHLNLERLEKLTLSAMKQSLQYHKLVLHEMTPFKTVMQQAHNGSRFICYCETPGTQQLATLAANTKEITILVGPEGDFSPEEVEWAEAAGFKQVSLGNNRLRTETAAVFACALLQGME